MSACTALSYSRRNGQKPNSENRDTSLLLIYEDIRKQREEYESLFHCLAVLAFCSGLGSYTAQGMGMVRAIHGTRSERNDR